MSRPSMGANDLVRLMEVSKIDGVEIRIGLGHPLESQLDEVKRLGIPVSCVSASTTISEPGFDSANAILSAGIASELGCPIVRVFGGGTMVDGVQTSQDRAVDRLRELSHEAAKLGVTFVMETHDAWINPQAVAPIMHSLGTISGVCWDAVHTHRAGHRHDTAWKTLRPWIRHTHCAGRLTPDFDELLKVLKAYDGWTTIERFDSPTDETIGEDVKALKREA